MVEQINERELPTKAEMSALWRCIEDGALMNPKAERRQAEGLASASSD